MSAVLGIDPGVRGGLAVLDGAGNPVFVKGLTPDMTHVQLVEVVRAALAALKAHVLWKKDEVAFIEKVGYMPGDGGKGANTFGRVDGLLRGAVLMAGCPVRDVPPMVWQGALGCLSGGNKNVTKARAIELFPFYPGSITHATADALLIAEYGRRWTLRPPVK